MDVFHGWRCHCARHLDFMGCFEKNPARRQFPGLFIETALLVPLAIVYLIFLKTNGQLMFGPGEHFIVDLVGEYRHCHRLAAALVRARRAAFAPYDAWFFAVSGANRHIFPRRVCLPRVIHAQRSYHVRDDLDRARHLYRRSGYPMAFGADTRSSNIAHGISIVTV